MILPSSQPSIRHPSSIHLSISSDVTASSIRFHSVPAVKQLGVEHWGYIRERFAQNGGGRQDTTSVGAWEMTCQLIDMVHYSAAGILVLVVVVVIVVRESER